MIARIFKAQLRQWLQEVNHERPYAQPCHRGEPPAAGVAKPATVARDSRAVGAAHPDSGGSDRRGELRFACSGHSWGLSSAHPQQLAALRSGHRGVDSLLRRLDSANPHPALGQTGSLPVPEVRRESDFSSQSSVRLPSLGSYLEPELVSGVAIAYRAIQNGFTARFITPAVPNRESVRGQPERQTAVRCSADRVASLACTTITCPRPSSTACSRTVASRSFDGSAIPWCGARASRSA